MAEIRRQTSRNKGFYVRMRLLRPGRQPEKTFCHRYFKWLLWFSLSFYFFASFLFTHKPATSVISRTTVVRQSKASRALIESLNSSVLHQPTTHHGNLTFNMALLDLFYVFSRFNVVCFSVSDVFKDLKIYIYDLPAKYNVDWLNERCSSHLFASEVAIHRALASSDVRTFDPWEADFFFVPVYVSCNFSTVNGFPAIGHARSLISSAINLISSDLPFWNRSHGADHVFVASHDFGSCFHTLVCPKMWSFTFLLPPTFFFRGIQWISFLFLLLVVVE